MINDSSFENKKDELIFHFNEIYKVCENKFTKGWGSYLFNGHNYEYDSRMFEKQKLLFNLSKKSGSILEVGVYMGHSLLIILLANPKAKITCLDIDDKYSLPAVNYLKKNFKEADIKFIKGDSLKLLESIKGQFDLYHIDGAHSPHIIAKEVLLCIENNPFKKINILFDDIDFMLEIKDKILENFTDVKEIQTNCKGRNCYLEFKFNNIQIKKFKSFYYKFIIYTFPKRIINKISNFFKK